MVRVVLFLRTQVIAQMSLLKHLKSLAEVGWARGLSAEHEVLLLLADHLQKVLWASLVAWTLLVVWARGLSAEHEVLLLLADHSKEVLWASLVPPIMVGNVWQEA